MKLLANIFLALLLSVSPAIAQARDFRFTSIGIDKGLSHSTVNGISQDKTGYIWVATPAGLNRYDGYEFTTLTPDSADNNIIAVCSDKNDEVWAITTGKIFHFIPSLETFEGFNAPEKATLTSLQPMQGGTIAVGSSDGAYIFNPTEGKFTPCQNLPQKSVTSLAAFGDNPITGYSDGTVAWKVNGKSETIKIPENPEINVILPKKGDIYIGTEGNGLWKYSLSSRTLSDISKDTDIKFVRSLLFDPQGRLWAGTFTGLYIIDTERGNVIFHTDAGNTRNGLSHSSVRRMYADSQGGIWLGTFFGGLNYYHPYLLQFSTLSKTSPDRFSLNDNIAEPLAQDSKGNIWIGTNNGGLNIYSPTTGEFRKITHADGLGSDDVKAIYLDESRRTAFIGTHIGGMTEVSLDTYRAQARPHVSGSVYDILPSLMPGHLWLTTLNKVLLYDIETSTIHPVNVKEIPAMATNLTRDSKGRIWIGGQRGLAVFTEKEGKLSPASRTPKLSCNVIDVYEAHDRNTFWISTQQGLFRYDDKSGKITHLSHKDGIPADIVYTTIEDPNGNIWGTTNRGLFRLNPKTGEIITYNNRNGLTNTQFSDRSSLYANNGIMYFGGISGVTFFNPTVIDKNEMTAAPIIERLLLSNTPVKPGDRTGLLSSSITDTKELTLEPDQTNITIEFTSCDYLSHGDNSFQYMLEGLDQQWTTAPQGVRSVSYSKLPSGSYTFRLRMANNDGVWSEEEASIRIIVLRPWYLRPWVIILFSIVFAALVFFTVRYVWRRKSREKQQQTLQEVTEMKVRFFVNMSHELRTPLTLMLLPVNELMESNADPATMQKLTTIRNNTLRIQHIVNQLLDYRRAELGMFKLNVTPVNANILVSNILGSYRNLAAKKNIRFQFNSTLPDGEAYIDSNYIELIVNNLVTNAFKYTPDGGEITVDLSESDGKLQLSVSDSGCGIPEDKLDTIFTRFYQHNDTAGGYGIGLSLVKRLVELHHGDITVKSSVGKGTSFSVTIPSRKEDYVESEINNGTLKSVSHHQDVSALLPIDEELTTSDTTETSNGKKKILVVDDNAEILKYLSAALSKDFQALTAANGTKAIEVLRSDNIDLVISDVMMPDMDGVQLCRAIKRNLRTSHIPVILLSAKIDLADRMDGLKEGADDYIAKPFQMEELLAKVKNQMRTRESIIRHYSQQETDIEPAQIAQNPLDKEFLDKAVKVMAEHIDDPEFTTDKFAGLMFMSRSNLHLKMKALTGESTTDFIRRARMKKAAELLKTRRYTVAEVSTMTGYNTPSYFATAFKNFFGYPPSKLLSQS